MPTAPLHLGHMLEAIQTDIWVRFQKMRGNDCIYCCADDAHGTPDHDPRAAGGHHTRSADRAQRRSSTSATSPAS